MGHKSAYSVDYVLLKQYKYYVKTISVTQLRSYFRVIAGKLNWLGLAWPPMKDLRGAISTSLHSLLFIVSVPALAIWCQLWNKLVMFCSIAPNSLERRQQYLFNPVLTLSEQIALTILFHSTEQIIYCIHTIWAQSLRFIDFRCLTALPCENRVYH